MTKAENPALVKLLPEIQRAARKVSQDWWPIISEEDAAQEISLRLLEKKYAEKLLSFDAEARASTLEKIGNQIASDYRAGYDHFSGNFYYSTNDVREILKRGALLKQRKFTDTERMDLDEGCRNLRERNERYAQVIWRRYVEQEDMSDPSSRKVLSRAVELLTDCMNNVHRNRELRHTEGIGTRRVMTNPASIAILTKQEAGRINEGRN